MKKVFIDGSAGTTGLRIYERLSQRTDVRLVTLPENLRKDPAARKDALNGADVAFLCLPDDAAREAASMVENPETCVIDASTAHRTLPDWAYGFPELGENFEKKILSSKRIAVPGCHASGFISLVYPLVEAGLLKENAYRPAQKGFINATDLADYLTKKGMPFRAAYKIVGQIVAKCIETGRVLDDFPIEEYKKYSELFSPDLYTEISLETCVEKRNSAGGASPKSVRAQIATERAKLQDLA